MSHGDDAGLRLPPRVAPVQVILVAVKEAPGVLETIARIERELGDLGIRARADRRTDIGLGRRLTDWELKGVPVRIEVGPRDLATNQVTVGQRDDSRRDLVPADSAAAAAAAAVDAVQAALYAEAAAMQTRRIVDVPDVTSAIEVAQDGFARLPWRACNADGERTLNAAGISIRCVTTPEGTVPDALDAEDLVAIAGRAY
jgi:prolyl-tRNA synthetase